MLQSLTALWRSFGPICFTLLVQFIELTSGPSTTFQSGSGLDFDLLLQHLHFLFRLFCCRFDSVLRVTVPLLFQPSFSCQTDSLTFDFRTL